MIYMQSQIILVDWVVVTIQHLPKIIMINSGIILMTVLYIKSKKMQLNLPL